MSSIRSFAKEARRRVGFEPSQSVGLFVGVRNFEDPDFHEVPYAVDDAIDLAHLFVTDLELIRGKNVVLALAGDPVKPESRDRLAELETNGAKVSGIRYTDYFRLVDFQAKKSGPKGLFVVSVASHGFLGDDLGALVAADSVRSHMKTTGVRVANLLGTIRDASRNAAKRQIVLLDACRNQVVKARGEDDAMAMGRAFVEAIEEARGQVVLAATVEDGFAYDDPERQNGVFTAAILDGLRGAAPANEQGLITVDRLADYVQERVASWVRKHRPEHAERSRGITRTIDGDAARLPLAIDAGFVERNEKWKERRNAAIERLKREIDGEVITGALFDRVRKLLRSGTEATLATWVEEIEELDESVKGRRSFAYFASLHFDSTQNAIEAVQEAPAVHTSRRTEPKVGDVWTDPVLGMRFRYIPPGSFRMGSPEEEPERNEDEIQREVTLTRGYWMAETVVTQGHWRGLMGNNPSGFAESDEHPVEKINWFEAVAFANTLSEKAGRSLCYEILGGNGKAPGERFEAKSVIFRADRSGFRLPTEAQWEYAARAGTMTPFWTGENITTDQANYDGNYPYAGFPKGEYREKTVPVRSFEPNAWGLYEVHGNVFEWCWDWFGEYGEGSVVDPVGPESGAGRVIRGGSWRARARSVRAAYRLAYEPGDRYDALGFRLSRGPE